MSDLKVDGITAATANTAVTIKGLGTGKVVLGDGNLVFPDADGAAGTFITTNGSAALSFATAGKIAQVAFVQDGAAKSGTTQFALDNTTPQISEGNEFMTLAISPTASDSTLHISVTAYLDMATTTTGMIAALFVGTTANALAAALDHSGQGDLTEGTNLSAVMTSGTTDALTFRVRGGAYISGTMYFNQGSTSGAYFGGKMASTITIMEILA